MNKTRLSSLERGRSAWLQKGFTLVELMISMVIGLLIVLALLTMLVNVNRNNSEMTKTNRVIENGRFALQLLQADVSHAGYWGGWVPEFDDLTRAGAPSDVPTGVPDPCLAYTTPADWTLAHKQNLIGLPVQSYQLGTVTIPVCAARVVSPQPDTDALFVRHVETCAAGVDAGCAALTAGDLYFQTNRCGTPTYALDAYVDAGTVDTVFPNKKRAVGVVVGGGAISTPLCTDVAVPFEEKRKFISNLYYVRNFAVTAGDGIPTLMRSQFENGQHGAAQAMIEGIEGFRVEFGIDNVSDSGSAVTTATIAWADTSKLISPTNRGDGIPDDQALGNGAFVRCDSPGVAPCTLDRMRNAVAARIYVLVRSETRTLGYVDNKTYQLGTKSYTPAPADQNFKRHLFTQTVRFVNVSARRETPP